MDPFLAANFDDIVGLIVTLAIIGFSVLSQVLSDKGKKKPPKPPKRTPQARPPQSIESEIEDFLRQARGEPAPARKPPVARNVGMDRPIEVAPIEVEPFDVDAPVEPGRGFARQLSEHVDEHIGRDSISQRDARLAHATEAADERIEQHLEDVFEHDIGKIAHAEEVNYDVAEGTDAAAWEKKAPETTGLADEIAQMMKSPDSVRKMFIMAEILKRPEL